MDYNSQMYKDIKKAFNLSLDFNFDWSFAMLLVEHLETGSWDFVLNVEWPNDVVCNYSGQWIEHETELDMIEFTLVTSEINIYLQYKYGGYLELQVSDKKKSRLALLWQALHIIAKAINGDYAKRT